MYHHHENRDFMPAAKPIFSIPEIKIPEPEDSPSGVRLTRLHDIFRAAAVFVAYFVAGELGLAVPFTSGNVSPVWPASGIALAAVLLCVCVCGYRVWPGIAAAAFLLNFLTPIPAPAAAAIAVGNTSGALLAGYLLNRVPGFQRSLTRLRDALKLLSAGRCRQSNCSGHRRCRALFLSGVRPSSAGTGMADLVAGGRDGYFGGKPFVAYAALSRSAGHSPTLLSWNGCAWRVARNHGWNHLSRPALVRQPG